MQLTENNGEKVANLLKQVETLNIPGNTMNNPITVSAEIYAEIDTVWQAYNDPTHIKKWNAASDAWYCSHSENVFRE